MARTARGASREASAALHPRALAPDNLILTLLLSVFGAVVGIQVLTSLGITPSTSLIGALVAMTLARIPLVIFRGFRSVHAQNLAQTSISSATFGAANSLILPIGIPYLFGLPNMVLPMLIGVSCALLLDAYMLYRMYGTPAFPADDPWPLGVAAAEAIRAGDQGGRRAAVLGGGVALGVLGAVFALPMSGFGIALIAGLASMIAFAVGLLVRQYTGPVTGWDLAADYVPHGVMIGAGVVALIQVAWIVVRGYRKARTEKATSADITIPETASEISDPASASADVTDPPQVTEPAAPVRDAADRAPGDGARRLGKSLRIGALGYGVVTLLLAIGTGLVSQMSIPMLIGFIVFATITAFVHEIIVGIAAMRAGYFPAFAVALITLLIGILIGFPPAALVVLAGFNAATGPAFADMGYDLKAGYMLRGSGSDPQFEREGRKQQMIAGMLGFAVAIVVVAVTYQTLFANGRFAPINTAYVAAIKAGISSETAIKLLIWAVPGAILQLLGGARRQLGILLATGLLLATPWLGWMVLAGIVVRLVVKRILGAKAAKENLEILGGGVIAGDALYSFVSGLIKVGR